MSIVRTRIAYLNNLEQYDETSKKHDETSQKQSQILCEQCKRKFSGSLSYTKHKCSTRHFRAKPKEINCRKCNTSFPDRKKLYIHQIIEHNMHNMTGLPH